MSPNQLLLAPSVVLAFALTIGSTATNATVAGATCGVERWSVKTGTDPDASRINLSLTTTTTIASLTSLSAPSPIPPNSRVQPTETTVFSITATLAVYKREDDSDYHLVISDGNGHTMITEIADPACRSLRRSLGRDCVLACFETGDQDVDDLIATSFLENLHQANDELPEGLSILPTKMRMWYRKGFGE